MRHRCDWPLMAAARVAILPFASRPSLLVVLEAQETRKTLKTGGRSSVEVARTLNSKYNRPRETRTGGSTSSSSRARRAKREDERTRTRVAHFRLPFTLVCVLLLLY